MKHRVPAQWRKVQILTVGSFDPKTRPSPDEEEDTQPWLDEGELRETVVIPKKAAPTVTVRIRRP